MQPTPNCQFSFSGRRESGKVLGLVVLLGGGAVVVSGIVAAGVIFLTIPAFLPYGKTTAQKQQEAAAAAAIQGTNGFGPPGGPVGNAGSYNIGQPDPSKLGANYTLNGSASIDFDGDPHAYAPAGSGLPADDNLANAGHPGDWWGIQTDNGKPDGNPTIGPDGYYISTTSGHFSTDANGVGYQDPHGGSNLDATTTCFVALPSDSHGVTPQGAVVGDYVQVTNNSTGQTVWAVYGDSAGTVHNSDGQVEMSAATANAVGVGYNSHGTTSNAGNVSFIVYPGSRNTGKPGGG